MGDGLSPNKEGAPVEALTREGGLILASEYGERLTYVVNGALGEEVEGNRSPEWQQVLAQRTASGWASQDIATPTTRAKGVNPGATPEYQYFSPDLSTAVVEPPQLGPYAEPPLAPGVKQATVYLRNNTTATFVPLVTEANVAPGTVFGAQIHFLNATPDLSHVMIASQVALTGPSSAPGLYELAGGALDLVSVLPTGAPAKQLVELGYYHASASSISSDGSRVVWTTPEENLHRGHLYLRDTGKGETIRLDAAQGVIEPTGVGVAQFQGASSDGRRVFFTDKQRLTADSTAEPSFPEKPDLYECDVIEVAGKLACRLTDLTVDHIGGQAANVQGLLLGMSQDGESVYFVARGVLATNENGGGEHAGNERNNLYMAYYDGSQWVTTFIAGLANGDSPEWEGFRLANTAFLTARVSESGRYLAFMSAARLTGYDNVDASPEAKGARDEEVYLYDAAGNSVRCVSCNPDGARPMGVLDAEGVGEGLGRLVDRRKVWFGHWLAGNIPGWTPENITSALVQSRYLSDEGRLFFNSPDGLVPQASNQKENVYEYEPSGLGSCVSASGGCVSLISSGTSGQESAFIEATSDGSNVFFVTEAQLSPQDTDTAYDIYDARVCTPSSPCLTPAGSPPPECSTSDTCRPASPAQLAPSGPSGTAVFSGPGNIVAATPTQKVLGTTVVVKPKPLTRRQKLVKALKSCRRSHTKSKRRRVACERRARRLYGPRHKTNKKSAKKTSTAGNRPGRRRR